MTPSISTRAALKQPQVQGQQHIHQEYVKLHNEVEERADEFTKQDTDIEFLHSTVEKSSSLLKRAGNTQHVMDDSKLALAASEIVRQRATNSKIDTTMDFDLKGYVAALREALNDNGGEKMISSAADIGDLAYKYMSRVPTASFMTGPLNMDKRPMKRREAVKLNIGAASAPSDIKEMYHGEEDAEQAKLIKDVFDTLLAVQEEQDQDEDGTYHPIHMLEFILNPFSFSETIENLFFLSFLVKEGKVLLDVDDDGIPVISVVRQESDRDGDSSKQKHNRAQLIVDLDMRSWIDLCNIYDDIEQPVIAARGNSDTNKDR